MYTLYTIIPYWLKYISWINYETRCHGLYYWIILCDLIHFCCLYSSLGLETCYNYIPELPYCIAFTVYFMSTLALVIQFTLFAHSIGTGKLLVQICRSITQKNTCTNLQDSLVGLMILLETNSFYLGYNILLHFLLFN